jgi:hypothetical protein
MNYVNYCLKNVKQFLFFVLFFSYCLGSVVFVSAFPEFEFSDSSYGSGEVDVNFEASRGVRVSLYSNDDFVESIDVYGEPITVDIGAGLVDIIIPVNSNLIFKNSHPSESFTLSVPGVFTTTLNPGQESSSYFFDTVNNYDLTEDVSGFRKQIIVEDGVTSSTFFNIAQSYLVDGENIFRFQLTSLTNSFEAESFEYSVDYDKFPNKIIVDDFNNVTKEKFVMVSGYVDDSRYPLYYVLNLNGNLGNTGAFIPVEVSGGAFNFSVGGLSNGLNSIRFISTDEINKNIFTGEEIVNVFVDTEKPVIDIVDIFFRSNTDNTKKAFLEDGNIDTNSNSIILNISVDASTLNYTFNNKTEIVPIVGGTIELALSLKSGKNNLDLVVIDDAGNVAHKAHQINYDNEEPKIEEDSLSPDSVFKEESVHFFLQNIEGTTNKPNVKMVIFTIPEDVTDDSGNSVSCNDYSNLFFRQTDDRDEYTYDPIESIPDAQLSLLSLISQKEELTSDSNGNFESLISLQEKNIDIDDATGTRVQDVKTRNTICIYMVDRFGNEEFESYKVDFDAGNTVWDDVEITVSPQNVYESELLQLEEGERSGSGNVEVGIIAKFQYLGGSDVSKIDSVRIVEDTSTFPDTKYVDVDSTRVNWAYEKDSNLMTVYIPVEVKGITSQDDRDEREWFEEIELGFGLNIIYTLDDIDVPIDTTNPVWFQTSIIVENTQDWLSVKQIEKWQGYLNKTIDVTQKFTDGMKWASVGGVAYCTFAKFYHGYEVAQLELENPDDKKIQREEIDRDLYMACDRIAGLPAPYACDDSTIEDNLLSPDEYKNGVDYSRNGEVVGQFTPRDISNKVQCNTDTQDTKGDLNGVWVSGEGKSFKDESGTGFTRTVESEVVFTQTCLPFSDGKVDFGTVKGQMCYQVGAPNFDDTKCNFFTLDDPEGVSGKSSATSIISSIRCGVITDTYSHSKNLLKIQQGIYDCLEQAKVGTVKGSYCQRLFGQAVCDVATNVILPELQQSFNPNSEAGGSREDGGTGLNFLGQMNKNEKVFDERYGGSVLGQAGLQSDQILNKACFGAITGDWSALTENILVSIDANEVEPVFGPPFAESRLQGYDPVTGELSIRYLFTYGAMSGGQAITTKVQLICDTGSPNKDFCPDDGIIVSDEVNAGSFKSKTIVVREGSSKQESQIITEAPARVWYNVLRMTHTYELKGVTQTVSQDFPIDHKTESLFAQCTFTGGLLGAGAGYSCDSIFGDVDSFDSAVGLDKDLTKLVPSASATSSASRPYYEGNSIFANIHYSAKNDVVYPEDLSLFYIGVCESSGNVTNVKFNPASGSNGIGSIKLTNDDNTLQSGELVELFKDLPEVGASSGGNVASVSKIVTSGTYFIRVTSSDPRISPRLTISKILVGNEVVSVLDRKYFNDSGYYGYSFVVPSNINGSLKIYSSDSFSGSTMTADLISGDGNTIDTLVDKTPMDRLSFLPSVVNSGSCEVQMRILPTNSPIFESNFATYSPDGGTDEEGNILSNVEVSSSIVKKTFILASRPSLNKVYFSLTSPRQSQTVEGNLAGNNLDIPFNYILQDSYNEGGSYVLDYKISSSKYVIENGIGSVDLIFNKINSDSDIDLIIPNSLKDILNSNENVSYLSGSISGVASTPELTLTYTISEEEMVTKKLVKTSKGGGSINFYIKK